MGEDGYISTDFTYNADGIRTKKIVTTYELADVGTRDGLYLCSDGEIRYFTNGEPTYVGLVKDEHDNYYYINSSLKAIRDQEYWITLTNGLVEKGPFTFGNDGRIVFDKAYGEEGEPFTGLRTDADGQTRYYMNGLPTYAGLVLVGGSYYYIASNKLAVKNCTYNISKTNGLLPEGSYTFDENGVMLNPPTATQTSAVMTRSATSGYQVWVPDETVTYNYVYNGDKLSQMTVGSDTLTFRYDASGTPMAVQYNDTTYYYATNIQGDVIAILNTSGTAVVEYAYDAWGDHLSTTGSMAATLGETNPLRYRGYVYDQEYGLYYLSTRCYNPEVGRFLNADAFAATGQGMLGNNMFGYCGNNPVMGYDPTGLVNRRGVALGIGLALLAVATVVATVVTAGAASPLVATVATAVGTAVSAALAESAITTTIGAIKEDPIVYDLTITCGNQRNGCSLVYDYGTNVSDVYLHDGKTSNGAYGTSYSTGFVYNYNKPGDYGGTFIDASVSSKYKNADLGVDFCTDPSNLQSGFSKDGGSYAFLLTSGFSTPVPVIQRIVTYGVDYYWQVSVF